MNSNQNTNQPIIDDAVRLRAHPSRRPRPKSSTVGGVVFATSFQAEPKQATKAHKYQGGLTADEKAKCCRENLDQTVSLSATRVHNNPKSDRRRVSDRICPKPTYFRSASVGTTTPRQSDTSENFSHTVSQAILMSPRSHLRHVRQNLKKVYPTKMDENRSITDVRLRGKTTNSQPNNGEKVGDCNLPGNEHVKLRQNKPQRPRPFSVIENIKHFEFGSHFFSEKHSRTDRKTALESNANQGKFHELASTVLFKAFALFHIDSCKPNKSLANHFPKIFSFKINTEPITANPCNIRPSPKLQN